jgi:hypothetical protein
MARLQARLKKLEGAVKEPQWNWRYPDVQDCARKKLLAAEAELLDQAIALIETGRQSEWTEAHRAVWERWDEALGQATVEVHFPIYIHAHDSML